MDRKLTALVGVFAILVGMMATVAVARPQAARAQETMPVTAALAPADAPIFLALSIDSQSAEWAPADVLLRRVGLGEAIDEFWAGLSDGLTGKDSLAGENRLVGGELGLVVTDPAALAGESDQGSGLIGILSVPGRAAEIFAFEEASLVKSAADTGRTVERTTYNGVRIVALPDDEASAQFGDIVLFADRPQDLYSAIDTHAGDAKALADDPVFARVRAELPNSALAFEYADGEALRGTLLQTLLDDPDLAPFTAAIVPQISHRFGLALSADEAGIRLDVRLAPGTGIAAPADHAAPELQLDRQMPADTLLFFNGVDLGESFGFETLTLLVAEGLGSVLGNGSDVPLLEPAQYFEAAARMLTFDLRDDFARQMVGEYALAASATSLDAGGIDAVLVSGVDDPLRVADATSKLAVLLNAATFDNGNGSGPVPGAMEVDGGLLQVLDLPVDQEGTVLHLEFGVVGQRFLLGYRSGVRDFLAGPAETLAESDRYQAAMAGLPAARDWQFYLDLGRAIPLLQQADASFAEETAAYDLAAVRSLAAVGFTRNGLRGMTMVLAMPAPEEGTPVAA